MKDPAVLFYIDTWLVSTKEMQADTRGWYLNLILHQYDKGNLPNDIEELANLADVRVSEFERFKQVFEQVLKQKFPENENGRLENGKANEILRKRKLFKEKRTKSGTLGYIIKFLKAEFKVDNDQIEFIKKEIDINSIDIKNKQVLKQVLKQKLKLYINRNKDEDEEVDEDENFDFKKSFLEIGIDKQILNDWLNVRKNKKATNSLTAFNKLKSKIELSGLSANECIKIAAENSWSGFDREWIKTESQPKKKDRSENPLIYYTSMPMPLDQVTLDKEFRMDWLDMDGQKYPDWFIKEVKALGKWNEQV